MSQANFRGFSQVDIDEIRITSLASNKTAEISRIVKHLEIIQSLFDPTIVGVALIDDPTGSIYDLPLLGEEVLHISFKTVGGKPFTKDFWVSKVPNIDRDPNMQKQSFELHFSSLEQLRAITTMIDRGFKSTLSSSISNIITNDLKSPKPLNLETTKGIETIIIPTWNIWDTVEFFRGRAVSDKYHSPYFFFEDTKGFNFVSAEYLIEQKKKANNIVEITANPFQVGAGEGPDKSTIDNSYYRNAENFRIINKTDTASLINAGGISNRTQIFNVLEKSLKNVDMDFKEFANSVVKQSLDDTYNAHHSQTLKTLLDVPVVRYTMSYDKGNHSHFMDNFSSRQMFTKHLNDIAVSFTLYGDSEMTVGDILNIKIPRVADSPDEDQQLTGNYIIGRLRHSISDDQMFTQVEAYRYGHATKVVT